MGPVGLKPHDELVGAHRVAQHEHRVHLVAAVLGDKGAHAGLALNLLRPGLLQLDAPIAGHLMRPPEEIEHAPAHLCQVERLAPRLLAIAYDRHGLAPVEVGVAGGAVAHATAQKLLLARPGLSHHHAACKHHAAGLVDVVRPLQREVLAHGVDGHHLLGRHLDAHAVQMGPHVRGEVGARNVGKAGVVLDVVGAGHLRAEVGAAQKGNGLVAQLCRDGRRDPRRPGSHDRYVHSLHPVRPFDGGCRLGQAYTRFAPVSSTARPVSGQLPQALPLSCSLRDGMAHAALVWYPSSAHGSSGRKPAAAIYHKEFSS